MRCLCSGRLILALALCAPLGARAQSPPTYVVTDVETLQDLMVDELVTCPLQFGRYVSGSYPGCPTGRAPATGECGLSHECPGAVPVSIPGALAGLDHYWTHVIALPVVVDLRTASDTVFVFNAADHGPMPEESIEWTVWGASLPDTAGFPTGWELAELTAMFRPGWVESGACPGDDADDYPGVYHFSRAYRFVAVYANYSITIFSDRGHTTWVSAGDDDTVQDGWQSSEAELDAVARPIGPRPAVDAGPDRIVCVGELVTLTATVTAGVVYRHGWDTDGDGRTDTTGPSVSMTFPATGSYRIGLHSVGECGSADDEVWIAVRDCPLLHVVFDFVAARAVPAGTSIEWRTSSEEGTVGFVVERAERLAGPWLGVGDVVAAAGAGHRYRLGDATRRGVRPWYRIVELTVDGRGDASPTFRAAVAERTETP